MKVILSLIACVALSACNTIEQRLSEGPALIVPSHMSVGDAANCVKAQWVDWANPTEIKTEKGERLVIKVMDSDVSHVVDIDKEPGGSKITVYAVQGLFSPSRKTLELVKACK